jgi:hypothetical protein
MNERRTSCVMGFVQISFRVASCARICLNPRTAEMHQRTTQDGKSVGVALPFVNDDDLVAPDLGDQVGHGQPTPCVVDRLAARIVDIEIERPPVKAAFL